MIHIAKFVHGYFNCERKDEPMSETKERCEACRGDQVVCRKHPDSRMGHRIQIAGCGSIPCDSPGIVCPRCQPKPCDLCGGVGTVTINGFCGLYCPKCKSTEWTDYLKRKANLETDKARSAEPTASVLAKENLRLREEIDRLQVESKSMRFLIDTIRKACATI